MFGFEKSMLRLATCVLVASAAGCASPGSSGAASAGRSVDHLFVRIVAVPDAGASAVARHRIEVRYLAVAGPAADDGARVGVDAGVAAASGAIVADVIDIDSGFIVVAAPDVVAQDGEDVPMIALRSRAWPSDRDRPPGVLGDAAFHDLRGSVSVTSAQGAVDLTFDFVKEDMNGAAPAGSPPDREQRRMTVRMHDGESALVSTAFLGEVRLR